jgi:hypothetical protein
MSEVGLPRVRISWRGPNGEGHEDWFAGECRAALEETMRQAQARWEADGFQHWIEEESADAAQARRKTG